MRICTLILSLIIPMALSACKADSFTTSTDFIPHKVVITPDKYRRYEGLPSELTDILVSFEFNETAISPKEFGYPPERKIQFFDVKAYVEFDDGWLIASGYGEWGGIVFWVDDKGTFEIIRDDDLAYPIDLIADGDKLFLIQGMAHVSILDGHMLEIVRDSGKFSTDVYPINGYPTGFKQHGEDWIILVGSNDGYYVLSELRAGKNILRDYK